MKNHKGPGASQSEIVYIFEIRKEKSFHLQNRVKKTLFLNVGLILFAGRINLNRNGEIRL